MRCGWPIAAESALALATAFERRAWPHDHPLWQLESRRLPADVVRALDGAGATLDVLAGASAAEIGELLRHPAAGAPVADAVAAFPHLELSARLQPLMPSILRLTLTITPAFRWTDAVHGGGGALKWHVWVEDGSGDALLSATTWSLPRATALARTPTDLVITLPLTSPPPPTLCVRLLADSWLGATIALPLSLRALPLPRVDPTPLTALPDVTPLPRTALAWPAAEAVLPFTHFNPVQTAAFHALYQTDAPLLLAAPPGAGATSALEVAVLRVLRPRLLARGVGGAGDSAGSGSLRPPVSPGRVLYLAAPSPLVAKRASDWRTRLDGGLGAVVVGGCDGGGGGGGGLSWGAAAHADVVVATPAAWADATRPTPDADLVAAFSLVVVDAVHMVGVGDAGAALEAEVTRLRSAAVRAGAALRVVAASAPAPNVADVAAWLGISPSVGTLLTFGPGARPVPLEVHVQGFRGAHAAPRAAAMARPSYAAIKAHAPTSPALIFVSSRRQARLTVVDLIACAAGDDAAGGGFVRDARARGVADAAASAARDATLKHALTFGVGVLHSGLAPHDAALVARLFGDGSLRVLVATHDAAWGCAAARARLVIVKGTDAYDAAADAYVEVPPADVAAMVSRAGRAGVDDSGVAVVMAAADAKPFVKAFLASPPPVESGAWGEGLPDHVLGLIARGGVRSRQSVVDALTWTLAARRAASNPAYYGLADGEGDTISDHLSTLAEGALRALEAAGCVELPPGDGDTDGTRPLTLTPAGAAAAAHGVSATTVAALAAEGAAVAHFRGVADAVARSDAVCAAARPRHGDDATLARLTPRARWKDGRTTTKSSILLQAHLARAPWPGPDAAADARAVACAAARAAAAAVDVASARGDGGAAVAAAALLQCIVQGVWPDAAPGLQVVGVSQEGAAALAAATPPSIRLSSLPRDTAAAALASVGTSPRVADGAVASIGMLPDVGVAWRVVAASGDGGGVTLDVSLNRGGSSPPPPHALTPRWPGLRPEGWYVLAVDAGGRLRGAARTAGGGVGRTSVALAVDASSSSSSARPLDLYIVSDAYVGLDARCEVPPGAGVGASGRGEAWSAAAAAGVGLDARGGGGGAVEVATPVDHDDDDAPDDAPGGLGGVG